MTVLDYIDKKVGERRAQYILKGFGYFETIAPSRMLKDFNIEITDRLWDIIWDSFSADLREWVFKFLESEIEV